MAMSGREKKYWRIHAALQELFQVSDEDIAENKDLENLLTVVAKIAITYQEKGADKVHKAARDKMLESMGVAVLRPKGNT